jgi:hypothetical protein
MSCNVLGVLFKMDVHFRLKTEHTTVKYVTVDLVDRSLTTILQRKLIIYPPTVLLT